MGKCIVMHETYGVVPHGVIFHDIVILHKQSIVNKLLLRVSFDSLLETIEVSLVDLTWEVIVSITRDAISSNYVVGKFVNLLSNVKVGHIVIDAS
jgi:hypothetical protein